MYEYVNWMKCRTCGQTDCLFKVIVSQYYKKKTGNIQYVTTSSCKLCYLEDCKIRDARYHKNKCIIRKGKNKCLIGSKKKK